MELESKALYREIAQLIQSAKTRVAISVNAELALLYWNVGRTIYKHYLDGQRAVYGKEVVNHLAAELTKEFGRGWSAKHLRHCLRSAETFSEEQIVYAVRRQLSWTHLKTIAYEESDVKRLFYLEMAVAERWSTRDLAAKMDSMLYERTAISKKPEEQIRQELTQLSDNQVLSPDLVFKSTYVLDFLGLKDTYSERDLEAALVANLQSLIMELGNGFAFVERQKRILIDSTDYHLDLLFYHRKLRRLIAIDLKLGKFKPDYKGQMELYLRYLEKHEQQPGEESPLGLLLCSGGNTEHIELLMLNNNEIKVAQYVTELPSEDWFLDKLHRAMEIARSAQNDKQDL